eukprot:gene15300-18120_t
MHVNFTSRAVERLSATLTNATLFSQIYMQLPQLFNSRLSRALIGAASHGNTDVLRYLIERLWNYTGRFGGLSGSKAPPLSLFQKLAEMAARGGHLECIQLLTMSVGHHLSNDTSSIISQALLSCDAPTARYVLTHFPMGRSGATDVQLKYDMMMLGDPSLLHDFDPTNDAIAFAKSRTTYAMRYLYHLLEMNCDLLTAGHMEILAMIFPIFSKPAYLESLATSTNIKRQRAARYIQLAETILDPVNDLLGMIRVDTVVRQIVQCNVPEATAYLGSRWRDQPSIIIDTAARYGTIEQVQYLHSLAGSRATKDALDYARNLEITKFLHTHRREGCTSLAVDRAASRGDLKTLKFLLKNRTEGGCFALDRAAKHNHYQIIWHLLTRPILNLQSFDKLSTTTIAFLSRHFLELQPMIVKHFGCQPPVLKRLMLAAYRHGHIDTVYTIHELHPAYLDGVSFDGALVGGHLDLLTFLIETRYEGFSLSGDIWYAIGALGDLYLFDSSFSFSHMPNYALVSRGAYSRGRLALVRHLEDCYELTEHFPMLAIDNGHLELVRHYVDRHDHLSSSEIECLINRSIESGQTEICDLLFMRYPLIEMTDSEYTVCIKPAIKNNHLGLIQMLDCIGRLGQLDYSHLELAHYHKSYDILLYILHNTPIGDSQSMPIRSPHIRCSNNYYL